MSVLTLPIAAGPLKYPSLGDPKPRPNEEVVLVRADGTQARGYWTDDCTAWGKLHAMARKKPKPNSRHY